VAKPDKTDLRNAYVAHSMNAWAKATIDLDRERKLERRASGSLSLDDPTMIRPATSLELLKRM
jgi:hypothetical protein